MRTRFKISVTVLVVSIVISGIIGIAYFRPRLKVTYHEQVKLERGDSVLHEAIDNDLDIKSIVALIDKTPSNVNRKFGGTTPLHEAVASERADLVELLIKRGAEVDAKIDPPWVGSGDTALITAVQFQNVPIAKLLIDAGASLDAKTSQGESLEKIADKNKDAAMKSFLDAARHKQTDKVPH